MVRKRNSQRSSCPEGWLKDGIKLPVHLTVRQGQYAARAVGIARSVFNLMVATHRSARAQGHGLWPSPMELEKIFNELKHEPEFGMEYATEVSKFVAQGACRDFRRADENWRNPTLNAERPTFKKKNRIGTGSFLAASGVDRVKYDDHRRIRLPYLGSVKLKRELPEGIPYEVRIKQENGRWYASVNYWKPPVGAEEKTHLCGAVDVGITPLAVDSELVHYENPKALYRMLAKLQRGQRTLARRTLARRTVGSRGWHEAQGRINAIHRRINGLRDNAHHQVSRQLVRKYAVLAIESLNVAGMDKLPHQAKAIRDAASGGLLQKIRYKADWYGTIIVEADRFYPSSKLCSDCGAHNAELGREPYWICSDCGVQHDRNENAALNLLTLAINAARDLPKLALGPVGPDVTLLDGKALAGGKRVAGETGPDEGRTASSTPASPAVDDGAAPYGSGRPEAVVKTQLQLAI
jgi:putative transposase